MSDTPETTVPAEAPAATAPAVSALGVCPITDEFLAPGMKKHVDPNAPVPLRMMLAKGMVPLQAPDLMAALYMLTFDPDEGVRTTVQKTAETFQDRLAASGFRDVGVKPPVLGFFLRAVGLIKDDYAEWLIFNTSTPDDAVAAIAAGCSKRTAEIIGQNQLRLLRNEDIIRQLALNPHAQGALIDGVCDFAVRSGLVMNDLPLMQAARVRLFGPQSIEKAPEPGPSADAVIAEFKETVSAEAAPPMEEGKRLTFAQKVQKMNVAEKIKLATKGNKEVRTMMLRDSNKLVAVAAVSSPRITEGEILTQAQSKVANEDVLRIIYTSREYTRSYPIKMALVKNPKVPQAVSMKLLAQLHEHDVKGLSKDKMVPASVQMLAKKMLGKKDEKKGGDGH